MLKNGAAEIHEHRGDETPLLVAGQSSDPVTTQIVSGALVSAARQMVKTMVRTSFSTVIYESLDFAVVLYDRDFRLLAQGPTLPAFMGTMGFCIRAAVEAVGGSQSLNPGDVIVYNVPYGTGSHAQDSAVVVPVFHRDGTHIGYAANKAHWADLGALAPYCTNTTDVFQEGMCIPGVKIYDGGILNDTVLRMILANSRFPELVDGDLRAQIASCNVGSTELLRVVDRYGYTAFQACVERMIAHGEDTVRAFLSNVQDGTYRATCYMDDNGVDPEPIEFDVVVHIAGSDITVDLSEAPDAQRGPINCPMPSTVSLARVALGMVAGSHEAPNEGHFRPLRVLTRPGSMFHPQSPAPCFLYGWSIQPALEGVIQALSMAVPGLPSGSAGDLCGIIMYGRTIDGRPFQAGWSHPVGSGANQDHDGAVLFIPPVGYSRCQSPELNEAQSPVRIERWEFTTDSAGPGKFRGGPGWRKDIRLLADAVMISMVERTKRPSWGQKGGLPGGVNGLEVEYPDGKVEILAKITDLPLPANSIIRVYGGGGGGFGECSERPPEAVQADVRDGFISAEHAAKYYPKAAVQTMPSANEARLTEL
jgi:N-methylhydantoinase B